MKPLLALLVLSVASCASAQPLPKEVQAVIDRSHNARGNYSVFLTAEVRTNHADWTETDAEFQQGARHRIEVPATRIVNNCDTGENVAYDVSHARYLGEKGPMKGVCGIALDVDPILSGRMLKPIFGPYGRADRIELTGKKFVRRYAVTADGIIVGNDYIPRDPSVGFTLRTVRAVVMRGPQDPDMFTRESLETAFAPAASPVAPPPVP